ncbi:MAG: hypothetical protein KBB64_03980, partial [Bacteroidia bacterium]|nr:hypothetical protein [Bacteroidia bacterium]
MKKLLLLSLLLFRAFIATSQIIQTPTQRDYCTLQAVSFSYTNPPPTGSHYEWMYEDYTMGWSLNGPNNTTQFILPSFQIYTGTIGGVCMVRLLTIDDLTGQIIYSDSRAIVSSKPV